MATKQVKNNSFKGILVAKIDEYLDEALSEEDKEKRLKYRDVIQEMERLLLMLCDLE